MSAFYPHQIFRMEYSKMMLEAWRQETIHPANAGELAIVTGFFEYLEHTAIPLMADAWVFEAVKQFAEEYVADCFDTWERTGIQTIKVRNEKDDFDEKVIDFVAEAAVRYQAIDIPKNDDRMSLHKASDFYERLQLRRLPAIVRGLATSLHRKVSDFERRYLKTILENIREDYEVVLPRVMVTMRRVVRIEQNLPDKPSYARLLGISDSLSWYETHISQTHPLYPVTGWLSHYYKIARNVASHVEGMEWEPSNNLVVLPDDTSTLEVSDTEFIQRYRYFVTICEMVMSAILAAYSEHQQNELSVKLAEGYIEMIRRIDPDHPTYGDGSISVRPYS